MIRMMGLVNLKAVGTAPVGSYGVYEEELKGDQKKLDVDKDGKIEGEDLAKLRKQKNGKMDEADNPTPSNDHEVSMANNALDTIIRDANELKTKLGEQEKDIPAWIQDHISNAANYIKQAASNYHEYNTPSTPDMSMDEGDHLKPADDHKTPHKDPHLAHEGICEGCYDMDEVAPDGWEGTVKAMKKYKKIDNPWALAYYMKSKGYKSHKKDK